MDKNDLKALAKRVMALTGPDRKVLKQVFAAFYPERVPTLIVASGYGWREDDSGWWLATGEDGRAPRQTVYPPPYFTSLDAAMTLVPEGWDCFDVDASAPEMGIDWRIYHPRGWHEVKATAATPALALTAAALLARAEQVPE